MMRRILLHGLLAVGPWILPLSDLAWGQTAHPLRNVPPPPAPKQYGERKAAAFLAKASTFIRVGEARDEFDVNGEGMTVAILDTGLRTTHVDFAGRVPVQKNFTTENEDKPDDAADLDGHGTNVAGIIAAGGDHTGMAPKARVIPLKVLSRTGGAWEDIEKALQWVVDNHERYRISVVNLSFGDLDNWPSESTFEAGSGRTRIRNQIRKLREKRVAVVAAAGNSYFTHTSKQGMAFPAICRETISVGAVYDGDWGSLTYHDGAKAFRTAADRLTPFSQRLLEIQPGCRTTVFAPGAPILSSGIMNDHGESLQSGTSQASPVVAGVALLMQEYYLKKSPSRQLPPVDALETWLRSSSVSITDVSKLKNSDGKLDLYDNVEHTDGRFLRIDAMDALTTVSQAVLSEIRQETTKGANEDPELVELRSLVKELLNEK